MQFIDSENEKAVIKVVGVGGCGGNVVHYLQERRVAGVSYAAVNTDSQALDGIHEGVERVHIGQSLTSGLGAGADPRVAAEAAQADIGRLGEIVKGCDIVFVAAGMGKGTGTGASPVVARACRDAGALTVAVVTRPFAHENRDEQADAGIAELEQHVDSLIIAPNEKLGGVLGDEVTLKEALAAANDVLFNAVCGISEVITKRGQINLDFNDVRAVMSAKGKAVIGSARCAGGERARRATEEALCCPLMEDVDLTHASGVLTNVTCSCDMKLSEINRMQEIIREHIPQNQSAQFCGVVFDDGMGDEVRVTIIVTGIRPQDCSEPSVTVIQSNVTDGGFTSGRKHAQKAKALEKFGGDESKVPAVLRRQVS